NVTITMKCGDKTATLPLEVRATLKPGITLDTYKMSLEYTASGYPNYHYLLVSFVDGADPSSTVTWTSSDPSVASVSTDGCVTATELGHTTVTATTSEGYTASCEVYVTGVALRAIYKGHEITSGDKFDKNEKYDITLIEDYYYDSGLSKEVPVSNICAISTVYGIWYQQIDEYNGQLYFTPSEFPSGGWYIIEFVDSVSGVHSRQMSIGIY
ncbi:MAG: Ig-like domain-containing protein, partial [Firmicutes bacterium]|nr:Ig-like domain-containing protein [Bacillota bacterium]